jgi:hypothetical protein
LQSAERKNNILFLAVWDAISQYQRRLLRSFLTLLRVLIEEDEEGTLHERTQWCAHTSQEIYFGINALSTEQHVLNMSNLVALLPGLTATAISRMLAMVAVAERPPPETVM